MEVGESSGKTINISRMPMITILVILSDRFLPSFEGSVSCLNLDCVSSSSSRASSFFFSSSSSSGSLPLRAWMKYL